MPFSIFFSELMFAAAKTAINARQDRQINCDLQRHYSFGKGKFRLATMVEYYFPFAGQLAHT